jgi:hypothetical protein
VTRPWQFFPFRVNEIAPAFFLREKSHSLLLLVYNKLISLSLAESQHIKAVLRGNSSFLA